MTRIGGSAGIVPAVVQPSPTAHQFAIPQQTDPHKTLARSFLHCYGVATAGSILCFFASLR
jgi:hypothetical protein